MRPPESVTEENPAPSPLAVQRSFGPPLGHRCNRPVSGERLSLAGPRNCGQEGKAAAAMGTAPTAPTRRATINRTNTPRVEGMKSSFGLEECNASPDQSTGSQGDGPRERRPPMRGAWKTRR